MQWDVSFYIRVDGFYGLWGVNYGDSVARGAGCYPFIVVTLVEVRGPVKPTVVSVITLVVTFSSEVRYVLLKSGDFVILTLGLLSGT